MKKLVLVAVVGFALVLFIALDLDRYLTFEALLAQRESLQDWQAANPLLAVAAYFAVYVLVTALSLPGAAILTLAGGALFGLGWGLLIVSFASSIGATLAFLVARGLLRGWVQRRFGDRLGAIYRGVERDGKFYLFTLRLVPIFPFFVINLLMGLTPLRTWSFYWVSQLGMLPGTIVYVNAGTQLGQLESASGLLSPGLIFSFVLLGLFPWLARMGLDAWKRWRHLSVFERPEHYDYNLLVIGAGSGGLVSAYIAAAVKAKVALVEKDRMGGDCLNTGCVPSKTLLKSAGVAHTVARAADYGVNAGSATVDFPRVFERVRDAIAAIEPHDSVDRYTKLGVDCVTGEARLVSPWEVEVDGRRLSARGIVIATGGRPARPPVAGLEKVQCYDSESVWQLQTLPARLLVIGGGPIGCELAQAFRRLGAEVTMAVRSRLLPKEDGDNAALVRERLLEEGVEVLEHTAVEQLGREGERQWARLGERRIEMDAVLVAAGRTANTENLGLETVGIATREDGTVEVDECLRTRCPTVFACGDVCGPYQLTHAASHQAWYAAVNSLFGSFKRFRADYRVIPRVTFTDPELAQVGLTEDEAVRAGIEVEVTRYDLADLDRAITDGSARGQIKVLTPPGKDRILGASIVGAQAGEMLTEFTLAMKHGLGLNKILGTVHPYPTFGEGNKYAAGVWRKANQPERLLALAHRWHGWRRGPKG